MSPLIANENTLFRTGRWVMHSITLFILGGKLTPYSLPLRVTTEGAEEWFHGSNISMQ